MGRNTIPLLLSQSVARWSLAGLILAWTAGLTLLWQPPLIASAAFAATALRCVGGYVSSHDEKDDYTSYCWYGVSFPLDFSANVDCIVSLGQILTFNSQFWVLCANVLPIFPRLRGDI